MGTLDLQKLNMQNIFNSIIITNYGHIKEPAESVANYLLGPVTQ